MRYPQLCNWITISVDHEDHVVVTNENIGKEITVTGGQAYIDFLLRLDGKTHPYDATNVYDEATVDRMMEDLAEISALRAGRFLALSPWNIMFTIHSFRTPPKKTGIACLLNTMLFTLFLPVLLYGITCIGSVISEFNGLSIPGLICGYLLGITLHECSHAIAAVANGGTVYEIGVFLRFFVLPGAYVVCREPKGPSSLERVQFCAAGVEMNALLAGVAMILAGLYPPQINFWFYVMLANGMFVLLNCLMVDQVDGCCILSELLGEKEGIVSAAWSTLFHKNARRDLLVQGAPGRIRFAGYCILLALQIAYPVLLIVNGYEVVVWIKELL